MGDYVVSKWSLRLECGFTPKIFDKLWGRIKTDIVEPENRIGLEGFGAHGAAWNRWSEFYVNGGLVAEYWGDGSRDQWHYTRDPLKIMSFLNRMLRLVARTVKAAMERREPIRVAAEIKSCRKRKSTKGHLSAPKDISENSGSAVGRKRLKLRLKSSLVVKDEEDNTSGSTLSPARHRRLVGFINHSSATADSRMPEPLEPKVITKKKRSRTKANDKVKVATENS